jgi:hypothetical protein
MTTPTKRYTIRIEHDQDCESPADMDCQWKPYSFSNRHVSHMDPDTLAEDHYFDDENGDEQHEYRPRQDIAAKLESGLAFWLDYSEHGLCSWNSAGSGIHCTWDSSRKAGILIWEHTEDEIGGKTYEDRERDAAGFLAEYTDWCNGNCYGYVIESTGEDCPHCGQSPEPEDVDSCWGFIGDYVTEALADALDRQGIDIADCIMAHSDMHGFDRHDIEKHIKRNKTAELAQ